MNPFAPARTLLRGLALTLLLGAAATPALAQPDTTFRFQGQFSRNGSLIQGPTDFRFSLFDASSGGNQIGSTITVSNVNVTNGWVGRGLDFGADAFRGADRFLQIAVRSPAGVGSFINFPGRQKVRPVPYALHAIGPWTTSGNDVCYTTGAVVIKPTTGDACLSLAAPDAVSGGAGIMSGPFVNPANGHSYFLTDPLSWIDAENVAVSIGGHLATINDANENQWIIDNVVTGGNTAWIGFTDLLSEGNFVWIDGAPVGFTNWGGGEPNDAGGMEDFTEIFGTTGLWNDSAAPTKWGLVEVSNPGPTVTGKIYRPAGTSELRLSNNSVDAITIDSAGKVGIGTTPTSRTLTVGGADPVVSFRTEGSADHWQLQANAFAPGNFGITRYDPNANGPSSLIITPTGNVGIGTTNPEQKLHVENLSGNVGALIRTVDSLQSELRLDEQTFGGAFVRYDASGNVLRLGTFNPSETIALNINRGSSNVAVVGTLSKGGGSFMIDHPLDPYNKYLYHSFVESPDMMNVYNGNIITDAAGFAVVTLPDYFESLNREFRYQLTVVEGVDSGQWAMAKVVSKIAGNQFTIRTSVPNTEVSWQVTGIRHDAFARANPIVPEVAKDPADRGLLLHPDAFNQPLELGIFSSTRPRAAAIEPAAVK